MKNDLIKKLTKTPARLGKYFSALMMCALLALSIGPAVAYDPIQGLWIDGSTNRVTVAGISTNVGWVAPFTTNTYNLSTTARYQGNTNQWPAMPFGYYGIDNRYLAIQTSFTSRDTNSAVVTLRYAGSTDNGGHWLSNYFVVNITANGTATVSTITNADLFAVPFICLQTIENTNTASALTNFFFSATTKQGN